MVCWLGFIMKIRHTQCCLVLWQYNNKTVVKHLHVTLSLSWIAKVIAKYYHSLNMVGWILCGEKLLILMADILPATGCVLQSASCV